MAGYTRISPNPFVDGATITGSLFVNEFNAVEAAFDASAGHNHNGVGEGAPITVLAADALTFGANSSSDVVITFNTSGNDGTLTWDQSESAFDFGASGITTTGVFEAGNIDVNDITAHGLIVTSNGDDIELDAGGGRVIINSTHTNQALTVRSTAAASSNDGPEVHIFRDATGSSGTQLGSLKFRGQDSGGTTRDFGRVLGFLRDASSTAPTGRIFIECLDGTGTLANSLTIDHNKVAVGNSSEVVDLDVSGDVEVSGDVYVKNTQKIITEDTSGNEAFSIRTTNNNVTILEETGSGNLEIKGDAFVIKANDNDFSKIVVHDEAGVKLLSEVSGDTSDSYNRIQVGNQHSGTRFFCGTNETNVIAEVVTEGFNVYGDPNTAGTDVNVESTTGPAKLNITNTYTGGTDFENGAGLEIGAVGKAYVDLKSPTPTADANMRMLHDGNSYVISQTGFLTLKSGDSNSSQPVRLAQGSTVKLTTTADGIDVTGTVEADGLNIVTPDGTSATIDVGADYLTVVCDDLESGLILRNDTAASGSTPDFLLRRTSNPSTGVENLGIILFQGLNNATPRENTTYANIIGRQIATTDGDEDGAVLHRVMKDGTLTTVLELAKTGINVTGIADADGVVVGASDLKVTGTNQLLFGDNESLQIWQGGSNSIIKETDTNKGLIIQGPEVFLRDETGDNYISWSASDGLNLYANDTAVFKTVSGGVEVFSNDGGASAGPILNLNRTSSTPANNDDLGRIQFKGNDSSSGSVVYGSIGCDAIDVTNGQATGQLSFNLLVDNAETNPLIFSEGQATFNSPIVGHLKTTIESSTANKAASATLALANIRTVYTGSSTTTWTLPQVGAGSVGATLSIINAGGGAITLDIANLNVKILDGSAVSAGTDDVIIATGGIADLIVTGQNAFVCYGSGIST